jgi:hypothetical protein
MHVTAKTSGNHDCNSGDSGSDENPCCCRLVFSQLVAVKSRWMIMVLPSSSPSSATRRHMLACRWNKQGGRRGGILATVISLLFSGDSLSFCGLQINAWNKGRHHRRDRDVPGGCEGGGQSSIFNCCK